jgi:hypothetical protein
MQHGGQWAREDVDAPVSHRIISNSAIFAHVLMEVMFRHMMRAFKIKDLV